MIKVCEECGSDDLTLEWVKRGTRDDEELEATCSDCGHSHMNDSGLHDDTKDFD